jgi:glycosyltransferase involved in cell wall biosynthesis
MHAAKQQVSSPARPVRTTESVHDNIYWRGAAPRVSVCVPAYRTDVSQLVEAIANCASSSLVEIVVYDDGSGDSDLLARMEERASYTLAAVRIVSAAANRGRSAARNAAMRHARADWILLLDADMMPDDARFVERYLDAIDAAAAPAVIVGGYSLAAAPRTRASALHRWQAETSECIDAAARQQSPGRYVFSSNVLLHRLVLESAPFDESFTGWGWEDTDWGLRAQNWFPILHIDNTATHLGLDADEALMSKYARSGPNFALVTRRHPHEAVKMPLYRMAKRFRRLPFRKSLTAVSAFLARTRILPLGLRGRALKVWRACIYAEAV